MSKGGLYRELTRRIDSSIEAAAFLEASWYAYAVLEDRLISMLGQSGGYSASIKMLGPKIKKLEKRAKSDPLLAANFDGAEVRAWSKKRNDLMHAMAEGALSIEQVDREAQALATEGRGIVRKVSAQAMRLKRHRSKVAL